MVTKKKVIDIKPEKTTGTALTKAKKTDVGAPGDWRSELAKYAQKTVKMEENTATGNRISTRNGRLTYHDTPLKNNEMHVIILAALVENAYYNGPYDPDAPRSPVCFAFSEDGEDMEPHEKSHERQSDSCEGCQWNKWGSADQGRGKACKNIRRLAVIPMGEGPGVEEIKAAEIATLTVPVTSVKGYSAFAKELTTHAGLPPFAYRVRIWLEDDAKSQFRVRFEAADRKPLPEKLMPALIERVKEAEKLLDQPYVYIEPEEAAPKRGAGKKKAGKY